jgi:hypothetical protein
VVIALAGLLRPDRPVDLPLLMLTGLAETVSRPILPSGVHQPVTAAIGRHAAVVVAGDDPVALAGQVPVMELGSGLDLSGGHASARAWADRSVTTALVAAAISVTFPASMSAFHPA